MTNDARDLQPLPSEKGPVGIAVNPPPPQILVVEDEQHLADVLQFNLQAEGYSVTLAADGEAALTLLAQEGAFQAVLLDVMLPGIDGFQVAQTLRAADNFVPILMMTARGRPEDVLEGLEAGADDYLPKPFDLNILLARLHVLLRRMQWQRIPASPGVDSAATRTEKATALPESSPGNYSFAGRVIDFALLEMEAKGERIRLTLMEAEFLRYLADHPFRIIPRKELLEQVWRVREDTDTRAIDNFVVRLRRYIEDEPTSPVHLKTVRGVGYRFLPNGE
jgi:DNA-binding response OmpR family regulator